MSKYGYWQKRNQYKTPKHVGPNKRDSNNNIIYYESLSKYGSVIKHYQEFDSLNRKITYNDSLGNFSKYTYYKDSNIVIKEEEIFFNDKIKSLRIINYDIHGCIMNKTIISGNNRSYQDFKYPKKNYSYISPYEKVL